MSSKECDFLLVKLKHSGQLADSWLLAGGAFGGGAPHPYRVLDERAPQGQRRVGHSRGNEFQHTCHLSFGLQALWVLEVRANGLTNVGVASQLRHQHLHLAQLPFVNLLVVEVHEPDEHAQVALLERIRQVLDDDVFRRLRVLPGSVPARSLAADTGEFPDGRCDGVQRGSNRTNPTCPDSCLWGH